MKNSIKDTLLTGLATLVVAGVAAASPWQDAAEEATPSTPAAVSDDGPTFDGVPESAEARLERSMDELAVLRKRIADESIPLSRELNRLQAEYEALQDEYRKVARLRDSRALDLGNLVKEIQSREEQAIYLTDTLDQYGRNWSSRLPISELQRYEDLVREAELAADNEALNAQDVFRTQAGVVQAALDRLEAALGGDRFEGQALDPTGTLLNGTFVLLGPAQFFRAADGSMTGPVEKQGDSYEPSVVAYTTPEQSAAAEIVINNARGALPVDATLGNARIIEQTTETIGEHIMKGGPVVWPILALAGASMLTALAKWIGLVTVPNPGEKKLKPLLAAIKEKREEGAKEAASAIPGPVGRMLQSGVEHLHEPRELIEEIMYEKILATRLRVQRFLPFIAISAAAAPLLGLLGTVTGIIGTFKMITLFGTGDVKTLSGGISEALITTELGLIAAIPSLLLHAFLSRKARGITDRMEQAGMAFINQVAVSMPSEHDRATTPAAPTPPPANDARQEARDALASLLEPLLEQRRGPKPTEGGA